MDKNLEKTFGNRIRVRVSGICIKQDSLLLVKHSGLGKKGILWAPPGGEIDFDETAEVALIREFKEETGLDIQVDKFLFINEYKENPLHAVELFFQVSALNDSLIKGHDPELEEENQIIKEVRFVTFDEIVIMADETLHNILHEAKDKNSILNMNGYFKFCR
ncbi:NUDIX domain-containing protein [Fulvivirga ligni]|uniref:NUDIX domain-containing protein n=1 Tax=Fulvivirga ligni TaxID=2904246 RepID=UPI001F31624B|nr:NUDIX domain-containing protein [Fulvivirga ligni]UII23260.1 NUDIX domain-containing protein [Fulvivirga ligni]